MNQEGFQRLFSCYEHGINRLNSILQQDVLKTEVRNIRGRRARNIISYKSQNLIEKKKGKAKVVVEDDNNDNNDNNDDNDDNDNNKSIKRSHRRTSETEKEILKPLILFKEFPANDIDLLNQISQSLGPNWDLVRIKRYWSNNNLFRFNKK